jgi:alkylhydroperoxidase family enzyme
LKQALEASKQATPRLPLPPLSAEERERAGNGEWSIVNNGRMRRWYLPEGFASGGFPRRDEPGMTLGYPFQTKLFWIVSRANNCTYCLGHQESKLASVGVTDREIAMLDGDWSEATPAERAAYALARTMTLNPLALGRERLDTLRPSYTDAQIAEMLYVVASFNAMNRWTGALNIPQEEHRDYLTALDSAVASLATQIAPLGPSRDAGGPRIAAPQQRPVLESWDVVEAKLAECRERPILLELVPEDEAKVRLGDLAAELGEPLPHWVRLLAQFPGVGVERVAILKAVEREGSLDPALRAQVAWVSARHDRAWYAVGHALERLRALGMSDEQIRAIDGDRNGWEDDDRLVLAFAERLTVDPALVSDADVARLRAVLSDHEVAELIAVVAESVFFNRLTEAAALPLE